MKRILIDGTTISGQMDGLSQYILNVTDQLAENYADKVNFVLLLRPEQCPQKYIDKFSGLGLEIQYRDIPPIGPWRNVMFRKYLKKQKYDLIYEPSSQYASCFKNKVVYTIHDLIYEEYPEKLGRGAKWKRIFLHYNVRCGLRNSRKVIAVSEYTKNKILTYHPLQGLAEKTVVIYEGWEHLCREKAETDFSIQIPFENYFLYVGSSRGHKNLFRLLKAFEEIKGVIPWGMVIVGNTNWLGEKEKMLIERINEKEQRLLLTGWINEDCLKEYFFSASAFVFPSLSEGFGIPVLESFYYRVPLLCADNVIFPEIAGDAAFYFDPENMEDIAEKLKFFVTHEEELRMDLIRKGDERLKKYSWRKTADEIYKVLIAD